ncbi:MAG: hypothetical protein WBQ94_22430 [Terracidiphilus sp.]
MVSSRITLVAMLVWLPLASASQTQLAAAPESSASQHGKKGSGQEASGTMLRLEVRRVPIDVVVTDKQGNAVRGLKKDDFVVKEDKKTQTILSFDYQDGSVPSLRLPSFLSCPPTRL